MKNVSGRDVPSGAQLIDVREPEEFKKGHAAGAVNIPLGDLTARATEISRDEPVYLICHSGGRSVKAGNYLEAALGYENVCNVLGGTQEWALLDLPMERPAAKEQQNLRTAIKEKRRESQHR